MQRSPVFLFQVRQQALHLQYLRAGINIVQDQTMKSRFGLCVLSLLCLHSAVFGQDVTQVQPGVLIFCDDASVEKAAHSAVHKFNEGLSTGKKLALFKILSARKSENGSDSVYSLEFTTRKSDCHADSIKPWTECEYLPHGQKDPYSCNATVYMTESVADTRQVDCIFDGLIIPRKEHCMGCPVEIDEKSEDLKLPISVSIAKYNTDSDSTHLFSLHDVGYATRQVVAGWRYMLRFDMRKTNCSKAEHKDLHDLCTHDDDNVEFSYCNSTVDVAQWRLTPAEAVMDCDAGAMPPSILTRRRPPGWSPLREFNTYTSISPPPQPPPTPAQTQASPPKPPKAKEESSEEDTKTPKPTSSPDAVNDNPFHCPSKPWKPFRPLDIGVIPPPAEPNSPQPAVQGALQDTDLLA